DPTGGSFSRFFNGDIWNGWLVGGGFLQAQAELAGEYYGAVLNQVKGETGVAPKIVLTGHSLGGGLAGMIGIVNDIEAVIFDNMPFQLSASRIYDRAKEASGKTNAEVRAEVFNRFFPTPLSGTELDDANAFIDTLMAEEFAKHDEYLMRYYGWDPELDENGIPTATRPVISPPDPDLGVIQGYYLPGEVNEILRFRSSSYKPDEVGEATDAENIADMPLPTGTPFSEGRSRGLHSQGHLILRFFSDMESLLDDKSASEVWEPEVRKHVMKAIFDSEVARQLEYGGDRPYSEMLTEMGYTALGKDDGSHSYATVYGDTGLRALTNDLVEFGRLMAANQLSRLSTEQLEEFSRILVHFAGQMTKGKVEFKKGKNDDFDPEKGVVDILTYDGEELDANVDANRAEILRIKTDNELWQLEADGTSSDTPAPGQKIIGLTDVIEGMSFGESDWMRKALAAPEEFFSSAGGEDFIPILDLMRLQYDQINPGPDGEGKAAGAEKGVLDYIDAVLMPLANDGPDRVIVGDPEGSYSKENTANLYLAAGGETEIVGDDGHNVIFVEHNAEIWGQYGRDTLIGKIAPVTFVDSMTVMPKHHEVSDGRDNDVYIGNVDRLTRTEWEQYYEGRKGKDDEPKSVLRYTTHENPDDDREERGLILSSILFLDEVTPEVDLDPALQSLALMEVTVTDPGSGGRTSKDLILGIDEIRLTSYADYVRADVENFGKPVHVISDDFDVGGTSAREYDTIDFRPLGEADDDTAHGLNYVNGVASLRDATDDRASLGDLFKVGFYALETAQTALGSIDPEEVMTIDGVEQIVGTEHADVIITGEIPYIDDLFGVQLRGEPTQIGEIQSGDGEDIIMVFQPRLIESGDTVPVELGGYEGPDGDTTADRDLRMIIDGGADDDYIFAAGGEGAITIGGTGRDWIFNASRGGLIIGDTRDGVDPDNPGDSNPFNKADKDGDDVYDHSDLIWFWGSTVMLDPKNDDVLSFFGYRLAGGSNELPFIFGTKALKGVGGASFGVALAEAFSPIFWDPFMPFITYWLEQKDRTLYVTNIFEKLFARFIDPKFAKPGIGGVMTFVNYDGQKFLEDTDIFGLPGGPPADDEEPVTDLGIILEVENPLDELFAMIPGFPGGLNRFSSLVSSVITLAQQAARLSKVNDWFDGKDPLVIDLDGDGIETLALDEFDVYFDIDGDFFRERSGWLDPDDGFVVLDRNGNGEIDDISEMFGGRTGRGLEDLAAFDENGDGVIDVADAIYSELRIWQDFDSDGETDEGELSTLADLGIASISLEGTEMDITTPQGANLIGTGQVTLFCGEMRNSFEAIFDASDLL
ncbi:MAG: hypothetical protein AAFQ33_05140, partial [Pseudomonadota bacterium]